MDRNIDSISKKDKRRQQISQRMSKLDMTFVAEKDNFYGALLHNLQTTLATLQQGTNEEFLKQKTTIEESRDYELTRLRLWEEYQVKRIELRYKDDLTKAKENHDRIIKLVKEKLYDKLQKQIKQLKEDKLLLNLVNANSWNSVVSNDSSTQALNAVVGSLNLNERRSLRKRELSSRFTPGEADDLSDGGAGTTSVGGSGHLSVARGYVSSSGKRRRHYATRYSSADEASSATSAGQNNGNKNHGHNQNGASSGYDSNLSDKDYDALNDIIMGNEDGGVSLVLSDGSKNKPNTRGSHKQFTGVQGLKPEELNEDLALLRGAIQKR